VDTTDQAVSKFSKSYADHEECLTLQPMNCQVSDEAPDLKTEDVIMGCLVRAFHTHQKAATNEYEERHNGD
jgi:hypothetical protein